MSIELYYTNEAGDFVLASDRVRLGTLELNMMATENAVGSSQIVIDDPDGTFYTPGHRPLYVIETEAVDDDFAGIIGVFWTWDRTVRRGNARTTTGREVVVNVKDLNTLLTMRVQKGTDAERDQENDIERIVDWLINTAEVIGGFGDSGLSIDEREFVFEDSPVLMSETDYTAQDSAGVINDALQDTSKTAFLYNRGTTLDPIIVGMWYGHTDRTDFTSPMSISNDLADISPETLQAEWLANPDTFTGLTFAPFIDAELNRDPSRQITGAMVQWDGGSTYVSDANPPESLTHRDMVFSAELVKNESQATQRGNAYINRLEGEDDAITCSVLVPARLVNAFHQGMRVPVRFTHMGPEGYAGDPVNMRIAERTVRQLEDSRLYQIALDLRGESQPYAAPPPPGEPPSDYDESIFARLTSASGPYPLPEGPIHWDGIPQLPWEATSPEFDYVETGLTGHRWSGIQLTADGTLQSVVMIASWIGVGVGTNDPYTVTMELRLNGTPIADVSTEYTVVGASNLFAGRPRLEAVDVAVSTGDIISGYVSCIGANGQAMEMFRVPHGIDPGVLIIRGGAF